MEKQDLHLKEIKELAKQFTPEEIENCIAQQLEKGENICDVVGPMEEVINILSKAEFVKESMAKGISMTDAIRDLAKRIRAIQQGFKDYPK